MTAWVWPTARSISWTPLAVVSACLAAVAAWQDGWPPGLVGIAAGALAAAQVVGLRDPAAALLAALPTGPVVRQSRRLALLVPAAALMWLATVREAILGELALTAVGVGLAVRCGVPLGVAVPLAWAVLAWAAGFDWELR